MRAHFVLGAGRELLDGHGAPNVRHHVDERERIVYFEPRQDARRRPLSTQTLTEHGLYIGGAAEPPAGEHREIVNPGTGEAGARGTAATPEGADPAGRAPPAAPRRGGRPRHP